MTINVRGSCINVSFFFFVTVCVALVLDKTNTATLALCAAAVHELGHLVCMLCFGERAQSIYIAPFGFSITRSHHGSYRREVFIALAGPLANLLAAAVLLALAFSCGKKSLVKPAVVNISLALFNLLPIEPLDCGRAIRCWLMCRMNTLRAERATFIIGVMFLVPLAACGFYVLIKSKYNITLLLAGFYLAYTLLKKCN